jgi:hypothetical protein
MVAECYQWFICWTVKSCMENFYIVGLGMIQPTCNKFEYSFTILNASGSIFYKINTRFLLFFETHFWPSHRLLKWELFKIDDFGFELSLRQWNAL